MEIRRALKVYEIEGKEEMIPYEKKKKQETDEFDLEFRKLKRKDEGMEGWRQEFTENTKKYKKKTLCWYIIKGIYKENSKMRNLKQ